MGNRLPDIGHHSREAGYALSDLGEYHGLRASARFEGDVNLGVMDARAMFVELGAAGAAGNVRNFGNIQQCLLGQGPNPVAFRKRCAWRCEQVRGYGALVEWG